MIKDAAEGEKFTDTVGVLTSWNEGVLLITRRTGERVRIAESALVAGKVVPSAPARRRGPAASYEELARVAARAWRPVESERLGGWELRAASGFTRRANSVLPLGDPGVPLDEALTYVRDWYAARGLPAYIQTATGAEGTQELLCAELEARGWVREVTAELWIGSLAPVGDREAPGVVLSREADDAWLGRYQRKGLSDVALKVLSSGPSVWFATVPGAEGEAPAAIGRCVVDGRWAGFAAVEVAPAHRRQGLATAVMAALARRALDEGASAAWLQVEDDNAGARAMYAGMGFGPHHAYHHYRWVPDAANAGSGGAGAEAAGAESAGGDTGGRDAGAARRDAEVAEAETAGGDTEGRDAGAAGRDAEAAESQTADAETTGGDTAGRDARAAGRDAKAAESQTADAETTGGDTGGRDARAARRDAEAAEAQTADAETTGGDTEGRGTGAAGRDVGKGAAERPGEEGRYGREAGGGSGHRDDGRGGFGAGEPSGCRNGGTSRHRHGGPSDRRDGGASGRRADEPSRHRDDEPSRHRDGEPSGRQADEPRRRRGGGPGGFRVGDSYRSV